MAMDDAGDPTSPPAIVRPAGITQEMQEYPAVAGARPQLAVAESLGDERQSDGARGSCITSERGANSDEAAEISDEEISDEAAEISEEAAEISDEAAEISDEAAEISEEAAEISEEAAEISEEAEEISDEAVEIPPGVEFGSMTVKADLDEGEAKSALPVPSWDSD